MPSWNAAQYRLFERERTQPARDLAARIPLNTACRVLDIGCGPGNSTAVLAEHFPQADILGVDASEAMVRAAQKAHPALRFAVCRAPEGLAALAGGFDVVFSNACIQWIPDHPALLRAMARLVRPGGVLAVQLPDPARHPAHILMEETAREGPWRAQCAGAARFYTLPIERYHDILARLGMDAALWQTTYYHRMPSCEAILEWYRGTGLRPYLEALAESERPAFAAQFLERLRRAYPPAENGEVLFAFLRLFFVAVQPEGGDARCSGC